MSKGVNMGNKFNWFIILALMILTVIFFWNDMNLLRFGLVYYLGVTLLLTCSIMKLKREYAKEQGGERE